MNNIGKIIGRCPLCDSPVLVLEFRSEVVYDNFNSCARFSCTGCQTEFLVPERRNTIPTNITEDLIKKFNTRKPIEDMVEQMDAEINSNPGANLGEYRAGLFKAIKIVRGGTE